MDTIFVLQVLITVVLVFGLGIWAMTKHRDYAPPMGTLETIFLVFFAENNLNEVVNIDWFKKGKKLNKVMEDSYPYRRITLFLRHYTKFSTAKGLIKREDILPQEEKTDVGFEIFYFFTMAIVLFITSPFSFTWFNDVKEEDNQLSAIRIVHPLERGHTLIQSLGLLLSLLLWSIPIFIWLEGIPRLLLLILLSLPAAIMLFTIIRIIVWNNQWKEFWGDRLSLILGKSIYQGDQALYSRAKEWIKTVNEYPTIPLTSLQRLILVVFSIVQIILTQWNPNIDILGK